mmetsp:Transcript_84030/g.163289  ORF Transcript_84030/g.163289 Transcript_84030/m.163289 type:complete len:344 (+) Transcript_84030:268-1299(+)
MCSVIRAVCAKLWSTWVSISVDSVPTCSRTMCRWISACGLLEMSTTARLNAPSRGHTAVPNRAMPLRSPSALSNASPKASAQSSAVWWSSMCRSPLHCSCKSKRPCFASCSSMWSKNPMPVDTEHEEPVPSRLISQLMDVSLVAREHFPTRDGLLPALPTSFARFEEGPSLPCSPTVDDTGGSQSRRPARPGGSTTAAPHAVKAAPMSTVVGVGSTPRTARAWPSGVRTPTPTQPALTPATMSSGVSPTMSASPAAEEGMPSPSRASRTGVGSGLGGPSSMQTQISKRCPRLCVRKKSSQSLRGRPVTTAMPFGHRRFSSSKVPREGIRVSRVHNPGTESVPW